MSRKLDDILNAWRAGERRCDPVVLVLTNSHSNHTLEAAQERGVDRLFQKWKEDYSKNGPRILAEYIRELAPDGSKRGKLSEAEALKSDIEYALVRMDTHGEVRTGAKTLSYLVEAIYVTSRMKEGPINFTQEVYPLVCKNLNVKTKAAYSGIKYYVEKLYSQVDKKELDAIYTLDLKESTNAPEVKQFILCMAKRFRNR